MSDPRSPETAAHETAAYQPPDADPPTHLRPEEAATLPPSPSPAGGSWPGGLPTQLPATLGRYELRKMLGKGGMGAVYLAQDLQLDRPVALKIPFFSPQESLGMRERFLREAKAAGVLHHPNLCPVYDVGEIDGIHYLSMAYIEGRTLAEQLRQQPRMGQREAATLVQTLAQALQEAHDSGIIHRDLKPANIMINRRGQPIIMDFGLARQTVNQEESRLTKSGTILGTPAYMPPEQINSDLKAMGPGCDIYSLGIILYEMLTGRVPFEGPMGTLMATIIMDPPPLPSLSRSDLDPSLEMICLKALAKSPRDRFPSMTAFAEALGDFLADRTVAIEAPKWPQRTTMPPVVIPLQEETVVASPPKVLPAAPAPKTGIGCGRFMLGCGLLFVLLVGIVMGAVVLIVYRFEPEFKSLAKRMMQPQMDWEEIADVWEPPTPATPERFFPPEVGSYTRQRQEPTDGVPDLNVKAAGQRAVYRSKKGDIDVFLFRATAEQKVALLTELIRAIDPKRLKSDGITVEAMPEAGRKPYRVVGGSPQGIWVQYSISPPKEHGFLFWDEDWLFFVRSHEIDTPEQFLKDLLDEQDKADQTKERSSRPRRGSGTRRKANETTR